MNTVVVVGAGLGGVATTIRLLQFAREPVRIVLLERRPEYRHAGSAYHRESNHWHHVFNIQAGRMSVFREDVDDFVKWANQEADRTGWPPEWRDFRFGESGPAPRRIYPDYLAARLAQAAREAMPGVTLVEVDGEVVDLAVSAGRVHVVVDNGATLDADHVVLATGLERKYPAFAAGVLDHPSYVRHPYSAEGLERILGVRRDAVVAVIGSLLSAYDAATVLLRRGHTGKICLISRSGLTLRTYPPDHRHRVLQLPPPRIAFTGREDFVRRLRREWDQACATVIREYPDVSMAVVTERVAKAWEPYLPEILAGIPSAELRALLDCYGSLLAVLRVGVMPYTADVVEHAMVKDGQVEVIAGKVEEIREAGADSLVVSVSGQTRWVEADLVISNFGRESNYERVDSRLWVNLLRQGTAHPHRRTGRGVEVDRDGTLLGPTGAPSGPISVVGSPREGDEIVRNGRAGAFTFNLAAIKNHSVEVAATVLCRLESCYDQAATVVDALAPDVAAAFEHSAMLDVRRMTARTRADRQELTAHLDESLRAIQHLTPPTTAGALRFAVSTAATAKLTDLSVTPRDLRALLGLERR
jgi:uncharacterized NAD(P)/FAD-binding protein YdhS